MMIGTKQPMHLKDYLKVVKHVEAQIQEFIIRTATGDCCFFAGCDKLGTKIKKE